ncbi:MAG TPA: DUF3097 family protein [Jiangellales bacterium]|nr:DUF3097 family protein [Jiangellales bacterium]
MSGRRARVARASRIYVEGRHDAELVEKVWGDDIRVEGVVVEVLGGIDDLPARVAAFRPGPGRRLGDPGRTASSRPWAGARSLARPGRASWAVSTATPTSSPRCSAGSRNSSIS